MSDVPVRNVQRRRGAPRFGDRHRIWRTGLLGLLTRLSAGGAIQGGCGAQIWGQTRNLQAGHGSRIWGQTRNLQAGHGSRIWGQTRNLCGRTLDPVDLTQRRPGGPGRLWSPNMGTGTMSDVASDTFNLHCVGPPSCCTRGA
jgi:hypothetical protein